MKGFPEAPWFVIEKSTETNELLVSQDETLLDATELESANFHWIAGNPPAEEFEALGKIRYRDKGEMCTVTVQKSGVNITFHSPVRAITSGQSIVLYDGNVCLGGGEIT